MVRLSKYLKCSVGKVDYIKRKSIQLSAVENDVYCIHEEKHLLNPNFVGVVLSIFCQCFVKLGNL